jgi:predicted RNase H-like HicB family nuclease
MATIEQYTLVLTAVRRPDGSNWVAAHLAEMPGCIAEGRSEAEARAALTRLFPEYLASRIGDGVPVPGPRQLDRAGSR